MRSFPFIITGSIASAASTPRSQAVAACTGLNFTEKAGMMHGFGKIDGCESIAAVHRNLYKCAMHP